MTTHEYHLDTQWTGNSGEGTAGYRSYRRDVALRVAGKPELLGSADTPFRGDGARWNPEDLLVGSLSQCHLLSYLHACVLRGVVVTSYIDHAVGSMEQEGNAGRFRSVVLRPEVEVAEACMIEDALAAHEEAHEWCFIANSVNFEVRIEPQARVATA